MTYTYSIYRQRLRTKVLALWDGPGILTLKTAHKILARRERQHPAYKFFIVRDNS